jgi:hypothetical protein
LITHESVVEVPPLVLRARWVARLDSVGDVAGGDKKRRAHSTSGDEGRGGAGDGSQKAIESSGGRL